MNASTAAVDRAERASRASPRDQGRELSDRDWLRSLHDQIAPFLDKCGKGMVSALYRCADPAADIEGRFLIRKMPEPLVRVFFEDLATLGTAFKADSLFSRTVYRGSQVRGWSDLAGVRGGALRAQGVEDLLAINVLDPDGDGVWFGSYQTSSDPLSDSDLVLLSRIARHVAASHRLRRGVAGGKSLTQLAQAMIQREATHARARSGAAESVRRARARAFVGIAEAREGGSVNPLFGHQRVAGKWSLLERRDANGHPYVVAVRSGSLQRVALSGRENEIVERTRRGESSKAIASSLGISHSTVRVLLSRAYQKLGVTSRRALADDSVCVVAPRCEGAAREPDRLDA